MKRELGVDQLVNKFDKFYSDNPDRLQNQFHPLTQKLLKQIYSERSNLLKENDLEENPQNRSRSSSRSSQYSAERVIDSSSFSSAQEQIFHSFSNTILKQSISSNWNQVMSLLSLLQSKNQWAQSILVIANWWKVLPNSNAREMSAETLRMMHQYFRDAYRNIILNASQSTGEALWMESEKWFTMFMKLEDPLVGLFCRSVFYRKCLQNITKTNADVHQMKKILNNTKMMTERYSTIFLSYCYYEIAKFYMVPYKESVSISFASHPSDSSSTTLIQFTNRVDLDSPQLASNEMNDDVSSIMTSTAASTSHNDILKRPLKYLTKSIKYCNQFCKSYLARALLQKNVCSDHETCFSDYTTAIDLDCNWFKPYFLRAIFAEQILQDKEVAMMDYSKSIECNPNHSRSYLLKGLLFYNGYKEYDHALEEYTNAIACDANNWSAYLNRGVLLQKYYMKFKQAYDEYSKVIQGIKNSNNQFDQQLLQMAYWNRAILIHLHLSHEWKTALQDYTAVLELSQQNREKVYFCRAKLQLKFGNKNNAKEDFLQVLQFNPQHKQANHYLSLLLQD